MKYLFVILLLPFLMACKEKEDSSIQVPKIDFVKFLGHKGSGTYERFGNEYLDNSKPAILNAFDLLDGTEVDVQMSKDSVLLLFHDADFENCEGIVANVFDYTYSDLVRMKNCDNLSFSSLEEIVKIHENANYESKYLSLDLKVLLNSAVLKAFGGEENLSKFISEKLKQWISGSFNKNLFIETPSKTSYMVFEKEGFICYLVNPTSSQTAFNVSFNFRQELDLSNTYKKQTWVLNEWEDFNESVIDYVDFIQSDNLALLSYLKGLNKSNISTEKIFEGEMKGSPEFYSLLENYSLANNELLNLKAFEGEGVLLVISENTENENKHWKAYELAKRDFTVYTSSSFLTDKKSSVNLYIWNPNKISLNDEKLALFTTNF